RHRGADGGRAPGGDLLALHPGRLRPGPRHEPVHPLDLRPTRRAVAAGGLGVGGRAVVPRCDRGGGGEADPVKRRDAGPRARPAEWLLAALGVLLLAAMVGFLVWEGVARPAGPPQ